MSKIGNLVVEMHESADFRWGWESAERGEPRPLWCYETVAGMNRLRAQQAGHDAYHLEQRAE